jgi:hypothetical protein
MCDRVLSILRPWLSKTEDDWTCKADLKKIILHSVDLDAHMNEQWCLIFPQSKPYGTKQRHSFPFDKNWMEGLAKGSELAPNQLVGLVVSPALMRRGTETGDNYGEWTNIVPSRVVPQGFASLTLSRSGR